MCWRPFILTPKRLRTGRIMTLGVDILKAPSRSKDDLPYAVGHFRLAVSQVCCLPQQSLSLSSQTWFPAGTPCVLTSLGSVKRAAGKVEGLPVGPVD